MSILQVLLPDTLLQLFSCSWLRVFYAIERSNSQVSQRIFEHVQKHLSTFELLNLLQVVELTENSLANMHNGCPT